MKNGKMKRFMVLLVMLIMLFPCAIHAEYSMEDFSWLDDLTINQLKALDNEIHKRIPQNDASRSEPEALEESILLGEWEAFSYGNTTYTQCSPEHPRNLRFSFSFYPAGTGKYQSSDLDNKSWTGDDIPFSYEIADGKTVNVRVMLIASWGFSYNEDENGPYLLRFDTQDIYRKVEKEIPEN